MADRRPRRDGAAGARSGAAAADHGNRADFVTGRRRFRMRITDAESRLSPAQCLPHVGQAQLRDFSPAGTVGRVRRVSTRQRLAQRGQRAAGGAVALGGAGGDRVSLASTVRGETERDLHRGGQPAQLLPGDRARCSAPCSSCCGRSRIPTSACRAEGQHGPSTTPFRAATCMVEMIPEAAKLNVNFGSPRAVDAADAGPGDRPRASAGESRRRSTTGDGRAGQRPSIRTIFR